MSTAIVTVLAVSTGLVVIVVAVAVVLVVLLVTRFMRDRQKRDAEVRHDLDEAHERAGRAERDRDIAQEQAEPRTDPDQ
jgi:membrane protein implicated in regulation of membrane protease activity